MSNVYENLGSGNFNSHIDSDGQNGGMVIDNKPTIGHEIKKTLIKAGAAGLAMGSLGMAAACAPAEAVTPNPESTQIVVVDNSDGMAVHTSNEAQSETIETTPSPIPEPTETPVFSEERAVELNQQFQDFLNKQGEFTPEKMSSKMFLTSGKIDKKIMALGLTGNELKFEGYFFDYFEKDDNLILLMGFDGKDGERIITPMQIPLYFYKGEPKARFAFIKHHEETAYDEGIATITSENISDVYPQLNNLKGKCIAFDPTIKTFPISDEYPDVDKTYLKDYNSKVGLLQKLILSLDTNGLNPNYDFESVSDNRDILMIKNIDNISNIDMSNVPLLKNIYFE